MTDDPLTEGTDRREFLRLGTGMAAAATAGVVAAAAGAQPAAAADPFLAPVYVPVVPQRVYDSRVTHGRIVSGRTRTIVPLVTGQPVEAWCCNVTVTDTAGAGFLAMFPGAAAWPGNSTVNWWAPGQTIANTAYTPGAELTNSIRIYCGGGNSTHFVLDLIGALIMIDITLFNTPDALSTERILGSGDHTLGAQLIDEF
jgi:hypothetical protein